MRIPARERRNLLLVPVWLNGKGPFQFVLDTGVETILLTDPDVRDSLHLPPGQPLLVAGAGADDPLRATLLTNVQVRLPGVAPVPLNVTVLSGDALDLSRYVGEPVAGLIGADVFNSFVVEVRPATPGRVRVWLHDPAQFAPKPALARVPLRVVAGKPYLRAQVRQPSAGTTDDTLTVSLLVDTGAGHAMALETRAARPALQVPAERRRAQLGRGLSGPVNGWLGRVAGLTLGPYVLQNLLASYPDSLAMRAHVTVPRDGSVGYELLRRFRVWFDYPHAALWLQPTARWRAPFEYDMSGLEVVAHGPRFRQYLIVGVEPGSPGEKAGLLAGDELLLIDNRPAEEHSLTALGQLLYSRDGRHVAILARHVNGQYIYTILTLKRRL